MHYRAIQNAEKKTEWIVNPATNLMVCDVVFIVCSDYKLLPKDQRPVNIRVQILGNGPKIAQMIAQHGLPVTVVDKRKTLYRLKRRGLFRSIWGNLFGF